MKNNQQFSNINFDAENGVIEVWMLDGGAEFIEGVEAYSIRPFSALLGATHRLTLYMQDDSISSLYFSEGVVEVQTVRVGIEAFLKENP